MTYITLSVAPYITHNPLTLSALYPHLVEERAIDKSQLKHNIESLIPNIYRSVSITHH